VRLHNSNVRISISLAILSEIFIQIGYFFYELGKKTKTKVGVFSELGVYCEHDILKTNKLVLMNIDTSGPRSNGMKLSTFRVRKIKGQGHRMPK